MHPAKIIITVGRGLCGTGAQAFMNASFRSSVVAACTLAVATGTVQAADLMALYRFDGSTTADLDGSKKLGAFNGQTFNGTANGTLSSSVDHPANGTANSLSLNGGYIDLPTTLSAVNPFRGSGTIGGVAGGDYTITCWFKTSGSNPVILSSARNTTSSNHSMAFYIDTGANGGGRNLRIDYYYQNDCRVGSSVNDGTWRFGVVTYQRSTNTFHVIVDGTDSGAKVFDPSIPTAESDTIRIGGSVNTAFPSAGTFVGNLSDVAIFKGILTGTELTAVQGGDFSSYLVGAPTSSNDSRTIAEDTPTPLAIDDFGTYSDPNSKPLAAVKITTLASAGSLEYDTTGAGDWAAVTVDQVISEADITAGRLRFSPVLDGNGTPYATIGFRVGNGTDFSLPYTLTVNVTPVNDYAPTAANQVLVVAQGGNSLTAANFGFADADGNDTLQKIQVTQLPSAGSLTLSSVAVTLDQEITVADINAGNLRFTPASGANGLAYATFGFKVSDGTFYSVASSTMTIDVVPVAVTKSSSHIPFVSSGTLVGAAVFGNAGTYDGIPFSLWNTPLTTPMSLGSGVSVAMAVTGGDGGIGISGTTFGTDQQYKYGAYTANTPRGMTLTFTGLDSSRQYRFQFGYGDTRTHCAYNETVTLAFSRGAPFPVQLAFGSAAAGDEYALLTATVTNSTSLVLTLPQTVAGEHGPMQAGFSVHLIGTPYDTWANGTFVPALTAKLPGDNQDGDSLTNLQEYAFGTQPTVSTGDIVVSGATVTPGAPKIISDNGSYYMVFGRRKDYVAAGLTYTVEFTAGLDLWGDNNDITNPPVSMGATDGTIDAIRVKYPESIDTPSGSQKPTFSRVKVVGN